MSWFLGPNLKRTWQDVVKEFDTENARGWYRCAACKKMQAPETKQAWLANSAIYNWGKDPYEIVVKYAARKSNQTAVCETCIRKLP